MMSLYPKYRSYSFIVAKSLAAFVMFECIGNLPKSWCPSQIYLEDLSS